MTSLNQFWLVWSNVEKFQPFLLSLIQIEHVWTNFDNFKPILTSLNQFWQVWPKFDKICQAWIESNTTWHDRLLKKETWFMPIWLAFLTTVHDVDDDDKTDSKMGAYAPIKKLIAAPPMVILGSKKFGLRVERYQKYDAILQPFF